MSSETSSEVTTEDGSFATISMRDITKAETKLLCEATESCLGSNVHFWRVDNDFETICSAFSSVSVIGLSLGGEHISILTADKKVYTQGSNSHGQLGQGDVDEHTGLCLVSQLNDKEVRKVACGARHNAVTCSDGSVYCWGDSRQGQCGVGARGIFTIPTKINFPRCRKISTMDQSDMLNFSVSIKMIGCGELFTVAIDTRGAAWTWGSGYGLGHGIECDECAGPTLIKGLRHRKLIDIVCGSFHCIALSHSDDQNDVDMPSPDYTTSNPFSVSLVDPLTNSENSTLPFLRSSFYCSSNNDQEISSQSSLLQSHSDSQSSLLRSHSDTDVVNDTISIKSDVSVSAVELRDNSSAILENSIEKKLKTGQGDLALSPALNLARKKLSEISLNSVNESSITSSQYYSAVDMLDRSNLTLTSSDPQLSNPADDDHIYNASKYDSDVTEECQNDDASSSFLDSISIKTVDSDCSTNSLIRDPVDRKPGEDQSNDLFDGKSSLFASDDASFRGYNVIERTSAIESFKVNAPVFRLISDEDEASGLLESSVATEVWSWGKNSYGQLGLGDLCDRTEPTLVKKLDGKAILILAAGSYHSLAVTVLGQVYSWGDNTFGQLAQSITLVDTPKKIKSVGGLRVWDVSAGRNFSLLLGDRDRNKTDVFFCGTMESQKISRCDSLSKPMINAIKKKGDKSWKLSKRARRHQEDSSSYVDIQVRKLIHMEKALVRCVLASDYSFACITECSGVGSALGAIYKFARAERLFHTQLTAIQKAIIDPFSQTEGFHNITKLVGGGSLLLLFDSYNDLLNGISSELAQLTEVIRCSLPSKELFSSLFSDSFRGIYERYSKCYSDALAVGYLQNCNKSASNSISKQKNLIVELERHWTLSPLTFENLLKAPLMRAHVYCDIARRISSQNQNQAELTYLKEVISRWFKFSEVNTQRLISAGVTYKYWNECHTKLSEALKDPQRRLVKSSKTDPLHLHKASRLSSHSYILCNDVFVHVQFNRNFQVFPLVTLWADSVPDSESILNAIKITSPEDSFILAAGTPDGKVEWLKALNELIASCLSACSSHNLDIGAVNSTTGLLKAAVAREAAYTYIEHLQFKSATYKGMWLAGVPHGRGRMTWKDGVWYEGEFVDGAFQGYGQMFWPSTGIAQISRHYDGEWSEGKMCGHGTMRYGQGDVYVGNFKNSYRHGYGILKCSENGTNIDTIYVGDWENDVKSGYGVLDYIVRGEKYMGMWSNDQRNGYGVVVTVDGVYYEGNFFQNRLAGKGILLNDDNTCYEGEFTADMLLSGKGILTLPNGDFIDGSFYGKWGDDIKVNGVFSKYMNPAQQDNGVGCSFNLLGTTDFTIDASAKWKSLFEEFLLVLGCEDRENFDTEKAWKNVNEAVLKSSGKMRCVSLHSKNTRKTSFKKTSFKEELSLANNLKGLQEYLSHAFDTRGHPLNTLVESLVDVYRATYVGVGAHRRLLPHAIAEAKSYVSRMFNILRILFPGLHDEDFVLLTNETANGIVDHTINSMSLLHPLILPRLYPPLFTLYALQTEKTDAVYMEKLHYLNKRGDVALMSFLGIKRTFWLLSDSSMSENQASEQENPKAYSAAIDSLGQISTNYSPMGKIEIIRRTFAKIHEEIEDYHKGVRQVLAMDDLFPLFQYIVIRARVPHLGSEIQFIEDMVEDSVLVGEAGHMVTTLSACYFQIQQERDRD